MIDASVYVPGTGLVDTLSSQLHLSHEAVKSKVPDHREVSSAGLSRVLTNRMVDVLEVSVGTKDSHDN